MNTLTAPKPATTKQVDFIMSLIESRVGGGVYVKTQMDVAKIESVEQFTSFEASNVIGVLLGEPKKTIEKVIKSAPMATDLTEGMYTDSEGQVWKIARSSRGHLYALLLVVKNGKGKFEFQSGAMKQAKAWTKMTLEDAAKYGKQTGVCCQCGRTLTNPDSIEAGIGPICAQGF